MEVISLYLIFNCHEEEGEHFYLFKNMIEPNAVKAMFEEFKSGYDIDELPTREEFEGWLDEMVKHGVIKPVNEWDCFVIEAGNYS